MRQAQADAEARRAQPAELIEPDACAVLSARFGADSDGRLESLEATAEWHAADRCASCGTRPRLLGKDVVCQLLEGGE